MPLVVEPAHPASSTSRTLASAMGSPFRIHILHVTETY
jgi:hypothetical protein